MSTANCMSEWNYQNAQCFRQTKWSPLRIMEIGAFSGPILYVKMSMHFYDINVGYLCTWELTISLHIGSPIVAEPLEAPCQNAQNDTEVLIHPQRAPEIWYFSGCLLCQQNFMHFDRCSISSMSIRVYYARSSLIAIRAHLWAIKMQDNCGNYWYVHREPRE